MLEFLKPLWQLASIDRCHVDSNISRLHYIVSVLVLVGFSIVLTSKVAGSDSILCYTRYKSDNDPSQNTLNSLCYASMSDPISSHNTITSQANTNSQATPSSHQNTTVPMYYQYQAMVFFLVAITFYGPKALWNCMENGITAKVIQNLNEPIQDREVRAMELKLLSLYIKRHFGHHKMLALAYFLTDIMYLINLFVQVTVLHKVFGDFMTYGISADMNVVFPKSASCIINDYTNEQTVIGTCLLPLNYLTDKFVFVLWWWFACVGILTCGQIVHHMLFIFSDRYRNQVLCIKGGRYWTVTDIQRIFQGLTECEAIGESVFLLLIIQNLESDTNLDLLNLL